MKKNMESKIIFKQKAHYQQRTIIAIVWIFFLSSYIAGVILTKSPFLIYLFCFLPVIVIASDLYLEWFIVYEDGIIVKSLFGRIKNLVLFKNVTKIIQKDLTYGRYGDKKYKFYIFDDGRPMYIINSLSRAMEKEAAENNKKKNLRIYATEQLIHFIFTLGINIEQ